MPLSKNDLRDFSLLHRKTKRHELGLFIVEGKKNCMELVKSNFEVLCMCTTDPNNSDFVDAIQITTREASRISHLKNPSPFIAIAKIPKLDFKIDLLSYDLNTNYIEDTLVELEKCYNSEKIPPPNPYCDTCRWQKETSKL